MNASSDVPASNSRSESAWLDALPPGTFVTVGALRRFAWPIDRQASSRWLMVKCDPAFSYEQYLEWLGRLPKVGVVVDAWDERHRRFLLCALEGATA